MTATDLLNAFAYPMRNLEVLFSALLIFLLLKFAAFIGVFGFILGFFLFPTLFHYLMRLLDARARDLHPGPLTIDDLMWFQSAWGLFLIVYLGALTYLSYFIGSRFGIVTVFSANVVIAAIWPASVAILAITRSPIDCLNPMAIAGVISRTGNDYWILPTYQVFAGVVVWWLSTVALPGFLVDWIGFYLIVAFFALAGSIVQPQHFHDEIDIHDSVEPDQADVDASLLRERTAVLNHAYGFVSRDNRAGGFKHIESWLQRDPDPESAWAWFFDQMLRWEIKQPALLFGQSYLHVLLNDGDYVAAVKVMMRCRHENDAFVLLADDIGLALKAAEHCQNQELVDFLRSRV